MLNNLHLAAVLRNGSQRSLRHIPLLQALQVQLTEDLSDQFDRFMAGEAPVAFEPGYTPYGDEKFKIEDFDLPDWLENETSRSVLEIDALRLNEEQMADIVALVAFIRNGDGEEIILFQNFNRSRLFRPGRFLFLANDTYASLSRPALTMGNKLDAVLVRSERTLLFSSFRVANTFLPLMSFYSDATEQEIRAVLDHELFIAEDADALAEDAGQWFQKRFAMLRDSGILGEYSAEQIVERSNGYEIDIRLQAGRIVFPADRHGAKRLLQFLNEELFRGAITDTLYETNSKREPD